MCDGHPVRLLGYDVLTLLIALPAPGALGITLVPKSRETLAKQVAFGVSLVVAVLTVLLAVRFDPGGPRFQFAESYWWIKAFGVHWAVGVDGVSLVLIVLSVILVPLVILASWHDAERSGGADRSARARTP